MLTETVMSWPPDSIWKRASLEKPVDRLAQKPADIPIKQASNGQQQVFEDAMVSHITTVESESKLLFYDCH